jgi:hypothetical protein
MSAYFGAYALSLDHYSGTEQVKRCSILCCEHVLLCASWSLGAGHRFIRSLLRDENKRQEEAGSPTDMCQKPQKTRHNVLQ